LANALDALLARIADKDLRQAIAHEVGRLKDSKDFGLVFERHLPESVRLAGHPITRGSQVQLRADTKGTTFNVKSLDGDTAFVLEE
jgi:adenine-specific DNA-methyltransferase